MTSRIWATPLLTHWSYDFLAQTHWCVNHKKQMCTAALSALNWGDWQMTAAHGLLGDRYGIWQLTHWTLEKMRLFIEDNTPWMQNVKISIKISIEFLLFLWVQLTMKCVMFLLGSIDKKSALMDRHRLLTSLDVYEQTWEITCHLACTAFWHHQGPL